MERWKLAGVLSVVLLLVVSDTSCKLEISLQISMGMLVRLGRCDISSCQGAPVVSDSSIVGKAIVLHEPVSTGHW